MPDLIHRINDEWVQATVRLGPEVVVAMLSATTPEILAYWHQPISTSSGGR